jgi:MYXO-CTERM domain-containing protein
MANRPQIRSLRWLAALALLPASAAAAELTIDRATTYQTIEGFGFFGGADVWWSSASAVLDQAWTDKVIDDLGISMWRNEYYAAGTTQDATWDKQKPVVLALVNAASKRGLKLKILLTAWSPPASMKCLTDDGYTCNTNPPTRPKDTKGGNILDPAMRADLAAWLIAGAQMYKDAGADLYALSLQNEPYFWEPYNSCFYAQDVYAATLAAIGPTIKAAFPDLKLFGAENMLGMECGKSPGTAFDPYWYTANLMNVPAALASIDAFAVHGYVDGVSATATSKLASMWTSLRNATANTGKTLWMTETSGYTHTWPGTTDNPGPLDLGQSMYAALTYGNATAWTYWQGSEKNGYNNYTLMAGANSLGKNYHVSKQFFRFIRPGAQRVDVKSSDSEVMAVAFAHPTMNAFTVVAINTGGSSKKLTLAGAGLPAAYQAFRTSAQEDAAELGSVAAGAITLPPSSITTLVNGSYRESGGTGGAGGSGGTGGTAGSAGTGGTGGSVGGTGTAGTAGSAGAPGSGGGSAGTGGQISTGGTTNLGGTSGTAGTTGKDGGPMSTGGSTAVAGTDAGANPGSAKSANTPDGGVASAESSSCGCHLGGRGDTTSTLWILALAGLAYIARRGRKRS